MISKTSSEIDHLRRFASFLTLFVISATWSFVALRPNLATFLALKAGLVRGERHR
jgi:hypothetical protein